MCFAGAGGRPTANAPVPAGALPRLPTVGLRGASAVGRGSRKQGAGAGVPPAAKAARPLPRPRRARATLLPRLRQLEEAVPLGGMSCWCPD